MKALFAVFLPIVLLSGLSYAEETAKGDCVTTILGESSLAEPVATKKPKTLSIHGDDRLDNYYWMNERDSSPVVDYVAEENAYFDEVFNKPTDGLQDELYQEIRGRIKLDDASIPVYENGYFYYERTTATGSYPIHYRRKGNMKAPEEVVLDENELAKEHKFSAVGAMSVSPNGRFLAYSQDTSGREVFEVFLKDLKTGNTRKLGVKVSGTLVWAKDNETLYYATQDEQTLRSDRAWKIMVTSGKTRPLFYEDDEEFFVSLQKSNSGNFLMISSNHTISNEVRVVDLSDSFSEVRLVRPREDHLKYSIEDTGQDFVVLTNKDAVNFTVMKASYADPGNWYEFLPYNADVHTLAVEPTKTHLIMLKRENGSLRIEVVHPLTARLEKTIATDPRRTVNFDLDYIDFERDRFRYTSDSMTDPSKLMEVDLIANEASLLKKQEVLGGYDPKDYVSRRITVNSRDGVGVPVSLVYKKGTEVNAAPTLLYAYGSYGYTVDPNFSSTRISLLDRGFVFAVAHPRGGAMLGRPWYEDGKLLQKQNTFNDYIDVGKALVSEGIAHKDKLFGMGGSAGGLLMGAVANQAPKGLFKGLIAAVPFVDVVTTMLDDTIPLTTFEYHEWGNPNQKEFYECMLAYSPVDNVCKQEYPHMLITSGYSDPRVQYWEPLKWVAKLRDQRADDNLLLLDMDMNSGHGGSSGRDGRLAEIAREYAFMLKVLELEASSKAGN